MLNGFNENVSSFELIPGKAGQFEFTIDGELVYSKTATKRFPELKELVEPIAKRLK